MLTDADIETVTTVLNYRWSTVPEIVARLASPLTPYQLNMRLAEAESRGIVERRNGFRKRVEWRLAR